MKKKYSVTMNSPAGWDDGCPTFDVWRRGDTQSLCQTRVHKDAETIVDALNQEKKSEYVLTLGQLLFALEGPDHTSKDVDPRELEVVFDTVDRSDLTLLSCYVSEKDGKVHIDIGTGEE